jgi:putative FmdB family regulatory protein
MSGKENNMPLYLYRCRQCGHKFESLRKIGDTDTGVDCPECGTKEPEKIIMPFYGYNSRGQGGAFRIG